MTAVTAFAHGAMLSDTRVDKLKPNFLASLRAGVQVSPSQAADAAAIITEAKQAFWQNLKDFDIILTLTVPDGAPLIDGTTGYQDWLTPWTVVGGPLICLPWGMDRLRRPRSVMLTAHPHKTPNCWRWPLSLQNEAHRLRDHKCLAFEAHNCVHLNRCIPKQARYANRSTRMPAINPEECDEQFGCPATLWSKHGKTFSR